MTDGHDLVSALAGRARNARDHAPVFRVTKADPTPLMAEAVALTTRIWPFFGDCQPRLHIPVANEVAKILTPEGGQVDVFHASGAIAARLRTPSSRTPLSADEVHADRKALTARLHAIAMPLVEARVAKDDELRFEALFETKAQGVTLKGERTPVALMEIVGAFRRYLHGLPVLGRASVHVALGGQAEVTRWGIDWRAVAPEPFATAAIIDPQEGAKRIVHDLSRRCPERALTLRDFVPASMTLGYISLSRRRSQNVMRPAWVAVLKPVSGTTMGHIIAVSAEANGASIEARASRHEHRGTSIEARDSD